MTTIINLRGLGKACTYPGCDLETGYRGEKRVAPAIHEVDGEPRCAGHSPVTEIPFQPHMTLKLHQVQILNVNSQIGNTEVTELGGFPLIGQAKRFASYAARDLFAAPRNRKIDFDGPIAFHPDRNGNPVPLPMRIVTISLTVGDWVHVGLHNLAQEPDCYKVTDPAQKNIPCRNPHQQVGRIVAIYKNDVSGWVADVDFQPLTHRIAGDRVYPGGVETLSVTILRKITPHLRDWEIFEGIRLVEHEEHCAGHIPGQTGKCMKPIIRMFYRWSDEMPFCVTTGQRNEDHHLDGIRHADGTGPWDHSLSWPFPRCQECGYEGEKHCTKCHAQEPTIKVSMEAYGNRTTCSTPGCGRDDWYDIGD